ncbi:hypothetical protein C5167_021753 [Papaver somniferum]|uniref:Protein SPIRAL1-like 1 n=1 Tax=Papaver somniferum TaxID=3469 RepID=A0A4Y7JFS8_PAPSO|nr:protein SPIRAL1-like 1 [Papaver somniferum]RZC59994.1 hypothetical protein C5167_021753 [Papaver somniferum]
MGRGVSYGGGQSSLGYLFAGPEEPKTAAPAATAAAATPTADAAAAQTPPVQVEQNVVPAANKSSPSPPADKTKLGPAGVVQGSLANNYYRADGQNTGNFITDRPSTKVHAAPGGGSSLGYLFGGGGGSN